MKRVIALVLASLLFAPPAFAQSGWIAALGAFANGYNRGTMQNRANREMQQAEQLRQRALLFAQSDPAVAQQYLDEARNLEADAYAERQMATPPPRINCYNDGHGFTSCSPAQ